MISIKINGEALVLANKAKLRVLLKNPYLDNDVYSSSYSFAIDIPAVKENHKILGFINFLEINKSDILFACECWHNGAYLLKGNLRLLSYDNNTVRANVEIATGVEAISAEKSIRDLDYGPTINLGATTYAVLSHANDAVHDVWPNVKYTFPSIYNQKFYDGKNTEYTGMLNRYPFAENTLASGNVNTLVPQVYFNTVLMALFASIGYTPIGEYMDSAEHKLIFIYGNRALDSQTGVVVDSTFVKASRNVDTLYSSSGLAQCDNPNNWKWETWDDEAEAEIKLIVFNDDSTGANIDAGGNYDASSGVYAAPVVGQYYHELKLKLSLTSPGGNSAIPKARRQIQVEVILCIDDVDGQPYTYVFTEQQYALGDVEIIFSLQNRFYFDTIGKTLKTKIRATFRDQSINCFYNTGGLFPSVGCVKRFCNVTVRSTSNFTIYAREDSSVNIYQKTLSIGQHLPDMKCNEFTNEWRKLFKLHFEFNETNKTVNILFLENYFSLVEEEDYTSKASPKYNSKFEKQRTYGYKYELPTDDLNSVGKENLPEYTENYENATEKISLKMVPLFWCTTGNGTVGSTGFTGCPWIESAGNSPIYGLGLSNNLSSLRLGYYYGMMRTTDNINYPMASAFYYDVNGSQISNFSLQLNTQFGILRRLHDKFNNFMNNAEEVEREVLLNISDINQFSFTKRKRIKHQLYLLKSADITIGESIEPATCTLLKF